MNSSDDSQSFATLAERIDANARAWNEVLGIPKLVLLAYGGLEKKELLLSYLIVAILEEGRVDSFVRGMFLTGDIGARLMECNDFLLSITRMQPHLDEPVKRSVELQHALLSVIRQPEATPDQMQRILILVFLSAAATRTYFEERMFTGLRTSSATERLLAPSVSPFFLSRVLEYARACGVRGPYKTDWEDIDQLNSRMLDLL